MGQRIIYMVRHGQVGSYEPLPDGLGSPLTPLGKQQAHLVGQRLRQSPIHTIYYSSLRRAAETATIIAAEFPNVPSHSSELLWECPWRVMANAIEHASAGTVSQPLDPQIQRLEQAFEYHFTPNQMDDDRHEILVCHGNVIRYFICQALQISFTTLQHMEICNCSLSIVSVASTGRSMLIAYNDVGHLPFSTQTYLRYIPAVRMEDKGVEGVEA